MYKQDYEKACKSYYEFEELFPYKIFEHYRTLVGSRNFGISINGKSCIAMVPLSDMLNHSVNQSSSWKYDSRKKGFIMTSNQIAKAQEMASRS